MCISLHGTTSYLQPIFSASYDLPTIEKANEKDSFKIWLGSVLNMIAAPFPILQSTCTYILGLDDKTKNNAYINILCVVIYFNILLSYIKNISHLW